MINFFKKNSEVLEKFLDNKNLKIKSIRIYPRIYELILEIDSELMKQKGLPVSDWEEYSRFSTLQLPIIDMSYPLSFIEESYKNMDIIFQGDGSGFKEDYKDFHNNKKTGGL